MDPMILIVLVVGFGALLLMNRRTKKKQQEQVAFRDRLENGQQVQTIGGLIGTVTDVEDDRVTLETAPGTQVVFLKVALAKLIDPVDETDEAEDDDAEDDDAEDTSIDDADADLDRGDGEDGTAADSDTSAVPGEHTSTEDSTPHEGDRPVTGNATSPIDHDGDDTEQNKQN